MARSSAMILLISSDAARRYRDDIVRALAHPRGTQLQFRYDLVHLDPVLQARARAEGLGGLSALICFMATDKQKKAAELASVRAVTIKRSELVGSSCVLTLTADDYVAPLDDADIRARLSPAEVALLPAWGAAANPRGCFALQVSNQVHPAHVSSIGDQLTEFEATAAKLGAFKAFDQTSGIVFYAVWSIVADDAPGFWWERKVEAPRYAHGQFELKSGVRYTIAVYSYRPAGSAVTSATTKLVIDSDEKAIRFTSAKEVALDSRYDLQRFSFTTDQLLNGVSAAMRLALSIPSGTPPVPEQRCDIVLPTRFGGWERKALIRAAAIAAGMASSAIIGVAFKDEFGFWIAVAMCIGPAIAAIAATFPLLRKNS
jgi:hypothetical protein